MVYITCLPLQTPRVLPERPKKISISFKEAVAAYSVALNSTTEKYAIRKDTFPSPQARIPLILSIASGQRIIKCQDVPFFQIN